MINLLRHNRNNIVKEAAWTISNVTAGNPQQIQAVIDAHIFEELSKVLETGDFRSQKEAAWVITNATSSGTAEQVIYLIERLGVLKPFCNLLESKDAKTVLVVLTGLKNLFALAEKMGGADSLATVNSLLDTFDFYLVYIFWKIFIKLRNFRPSKKLALWINWRVCNNMKTRRFTNKCTVSSMHISLKG